MLGFDESGEENQSKINQRPSSTNKISDKKQSADFADGDDDKRAEKAGPVDLRFDVRPSEAIDYFQRKGIVSPATFKKLEREAKAAAFMVSGIYREDLLQAFKFEITNALETGQTQKYLTNQFKEILAGAKHKELGDWHLENVARTNMQMAYGVGRRKAMEESADLLPFWEYSAVNDDRTRPTHRALDGIIYPSDHPFWDTHFPPWGWACRCTVIARFDMPDGYKHARPNTDTHIAFDKDGLPAKAEYLTQVYDLKATKFVGVPKIANLENALIDAAKAAKDARLLNHQNIPQVIVDKAREIRLEKVENLIGWDKDGNLVGHYKGNKNHVDYPFGVEHRLDGGSDLHNHPAENGRYFEAPSDLDYFDAVRLNVKAFYTITRNYLYQVRAPKGGWTANAIEEFDALYDQMRGKISIEMTRKFRTGELTEDQIYDIENHLVWKELAKILKFKYKRFKVTDL